MPLDPQPATFADKMWIAFILGDYDEVCRLMDEASREFPRSPD